MFREDISLQDVPAVPKMDCIAGVVKRKATKGERERKEIAGYLRLDGSKHYSKEKAK
jgi:hypothetical protein